MRKIIEDRLINMAAEINRMRARIENNEYAQNLFNQLSRSSSSAALNYGEALGAESRKDFTHKIGIVLKEVRESYNNLRIMSKSGFYKGEKSDLDSLIDECNQLVSIFYRTSLTLKNKSKPN
jgi:four helix bundle protein